MREDIFRVNECDLKSLFLGSLVGKNIHREYKNYRECVKKTFEPQKAVIGKTYISEGLEYFLKYSIVPLVATSSCLSDESLRKGIIGFGIAAYSFGVIYTLFRKMFQKDKANAAEEYFNSSKKEPSNMYKERIGGKIISLESYIKKSK